MLVNFYAAWARHAWRSSVPTVCKLIAVHELNVTFVMVIKLITADDMYKVFLVC